MAFLEVENLYKSFGKTEVLRGVDFTLERGEILSIIGSSGNGKTTLLRCLNFLEKADVGKILLNGKTLFDAQESYSDDELRQKRLSFGLVFQNFNLFPQYNALHNVTLALNLQSMEELKELNVGFFKRRKLMRTIREGSEEKAKELLKNIGLEDKFYNYPCELSGGQQQRVAIARALALSPDVLCFDEPTSALDPELTGEVLKAIKGLKSSDRTMIIVTHEMEFAKNVSDKILFMANGVVEEFGTPEEVFNNPKSPLTRAFLAKTEEEI